MELRFLGGAEKIGSLGLVVHDQGRKILFDYGMTPSDPPEYPLPIPPGVEYAFLSHCHLDHSGMMPLATRRGSTRMITTELTKQVTELMLHDALKVARAERYPDPFSPPEIKQLMSRTQGLRPGETFRHSNLEVDLTSAGHVPGATMFRYQGSRSVLFSGDVNYTATHLTGPAKPLEADVFVVESTYAGREHPDRAQEEDRFVAEVEAVIERGGQVIVPAFAVGRTQEVIMALARSDLNIWVDGMGRKVNDMYLDAPQGYLRDPKALEHALSDVNVVEEPYDRQQALAEADVIVTTGGMLDGGPVLFYLGARHRASANALFLVGYQVEGSNGRRLMEEGVLTVAGVDVKPRLRVRKFDFSSHAGHSDIVRLVHDVKPKTVVLMHGDERERLAETLRPEYDVRLPVNGETITLGS